MNRRVLTSKLAVILGVLSFSLSSFASSPQAWLAYGDLRGHLEPCGCDPRTDLGGVRRLDALLIRERSLHPEVMVFDLGNDVPDPSSASESLKVSFLLEALQAFHPSAVLFNNAEIARRGEIAHTPYKDLPFVLSNARSRDASAGLAKPYLVNGDLLILGYAYAPNHRHLVERFDKSLLSRWHEIASTAHVKSKVLLFSGSDSDLKLVASARLFDVIIRSHTANFGAEPGTEDRDDSKRLERRVGNVEVDTVPLGGQGVLRGGLLRQNVAKSIDEIFDKGKTDCKVPNLLGLGTPAESCGALVAPANAATPSGTLVSWLDTTYLAGAPLGELMKRYNEAAGAALAERSKERLKDIKDSPFIGSQACVSCHPSAFKTWQTSAHAHALATLEAKGKAHDGECVSCHVVGYKDKGGFVSKEATPQFSNVQCENCHGPARAHAANPLVHPPANPREACVSCHHGQHSPSFDFTTYWPKIAHGK